MLINDLTFLSERVARSIAITTKIGVVASTSPFEVTMYGDSVSKAIGLRLSSYTPVNGDKVLLIEAGKQLVCLGKIVNA